LGMTKAEIKKKFDEIVAFAEIEKFLDTPVKRYSSGMYVRLAFAVAAHLELEILIVDEVLAVGDAQFQKKCLGKMADVGKEGRTVLFVSHNMGAMRVLCDRGIFLEKGRLTFEGTIVDTIRNYTDNRSSCFHYLSPQEKTLPFFREISLQQAGESVSVVSNNNPFTIRFIVEKHGRRDLRVCLLLKNSEELWVLHSSNEFSSRDLDDFNSQITVEIPAYVLPSGSYSIDVSIEKRNYETFEHLYNVLSFEVAFTGPLSDKTVGDQWKGVCGPGLLKWF